MMPRDQRLYMTFPNDVHRHPKMMRLSVEARWAFIEMNGEARIADNDGVFSVEDARYLWSDAVLSELASSHPLRPLVVFDGDANTYVIRDYAEHQQTRAEREELSARRSVAGARGGQASAKQKQASAKQVQASAKQVQASAKQVSSKVKQSQAESESESELPDLSKTYKSQSRDNRARDTTDVSSITERLAAQHGITDLGVVVSAVREHTGRVVSVDDAWQVCLSILNRRSSPPAAPQRYVTGAIAKSPFEVQQFIDRMGGAA